MAIAAEGDDGAALASGGRPLRRDAERNRQKILAAAAEVFAERGLQARLDHVARRAGVGVGTVYRRFPGKEALAGALFEDRLGVLVAFAEQCLADPDPWQGLVSYLQQATALVTADRGLCQILMFSHLGGGEAARARARLEPVVTRILERAQAAGAVRPDLQSTDIPLSMFMLAATADYARPARPQIWRRYLELLLQGLRPAPPATIALPEPALSPAEMEQALRAEPVHSRST